MSVTTLTTMLAVNPAFLEEIKDSNASLWNQLANLRLLCDSHDEKSTILNQLVLLLNDVRDSLALQFALEESYGYMEVPLHLASGESATVEQIRSQHCVLYLTANELTEQAEELQYRGWVAERVDRLLLQVKQFDMQLQDHEHKERQLLGSFRPKMMRQRM